jgi:hypothetical protein
MELAKRNSKEIPTALSSVLQHGTVQMLINDNSPKGLEKISVLMPDRIEKALDFPIVNEVIRAVGEQEVVKYIHYELIKLANLVSVGGNLNDMQAAFIAQELVKIYPNETLADFKLCFNRGAIGQYGQIFRMDGIIIREWMEKYLEEKYVVVERKLMSEKEDFYKPVTRTITEEVSDQKIKDRLQEWRTTIEQSANDKRISPLTEKQIQEEGKIRPKAVATYPYTPLSLIEEKDLHIQYIRENYDPYTGKPKPNWISEDQWRQNLSRVPEAREVLHPDKQVPET